MMFVFLVGVLVMIEQPMMLVGGLILYTFLVGFVSYFIMSTFWYGCLLLLVMLSGVLVVFSYMASLSPNEGFYLDYWGFLLLSICISGGVSVWGADDHSLITLKLWGSFDGMINLFMLVLLLLGMLVVVWISSFWEGPIRI